MPSNYRQRSGWQAFVLEFCNSVNAKFTNQWSKQNYLIEHLQEGNDSNDDGLDIDGSNYLGLLVRKASSIWRRYNADVIDAWKERAKQLNAVPVTGMLESSPDMFHSFKGGLEGALIKSLFHDWKHLCHYIRKSIHEGYYAHRRKKYVMFGGDRVELTKMVYRNSIPIPFLLSSYLFGESFEKVAKLTVKKTAHSRLINIWSNERAMSLFSIKDLNAFRFWKKDKEFMGCGKKFINIIDPPPRGNVQGFVLGEDNDDRLLVETRNNFRLVVSSPTLEKYIDGNNKERFK